MRKFLSSFTVGVFLTVLGQSAVQAQCLPTSGVAYTVTPINGVCPQNSIKVDVTQGASQAYKLTITPTEVSQGATQEVLIENGTTTVDNLANGKWKVELRCNANPVVVYGVQEVEVNSTYTSISRVNITTSNVCTNYTPGGTITVTGVVGGRAPYEYSFVKNDSSGYPSSLDNYGTETTKTFTEFGIYQVRVKDACGNIYFYGRKISTYETNV